MKNILDFGCGNGQLSNNLVKKDADICIYGIDISEDNIAFAEKNKISPNQRYGTSRGKIGFPNNYFDEVYCYEVLEHVKDLDFTLHEIKRVLKKQGRFFITVPLKKSEIELSGINKDYLKQIGHVRVFDKEKLCSILQKYGFRILDYMRYNSIEHLYWKQNFKRGIRIIDQNGNTNKRPTLYWRAIIEILNQDRHHYRGSKSQRKMMINWISPLFYPISRILDYCLTNKKQKIVVQLRS